MKADDYLNDSTEPKTDSDNEPSDTYIQFNSRDHPAAYDLASDGGAIRSTFSSRGAPSVHDFYAEMTVALGELFTDGDKLPLLQWISPSESEVREYLDELENENSDD